MCRKRLRHIIAVACGVAFGFFILTLTGEVYAQDAGASIRVEADSGSSLYVTAKRVSDNAPQPDGEVHWSVNASGDGGWVVADQYLEISYSDVPEFWGIQIYSDNKSQTANPQYAGTGNPAGLVDVTNTDRILPLAWVVSDRLLTQAELADPNAYKPLERAGAEGFTSYMWHYLVDKNTHDDPSTLLNESFANAKDYVCIWNQSGFAWNEGARAKHPPRIYMYLATKTDLTYAGATYKTSTLTLELYHGVSPFPLYVYKNAPNAHRIERTGTSTRTDYRAQIDVLSYDSSVSMNDSISIQANVTNTGTVTWTQGSFVFRTHAYDKNGTKLINDLIGYGYDLPGNVTPGATITMNLEIPTPLIGNGITLNQPCIYFIGVDMVGPIWFDNEVRLRTEILPQGVTPTNNLENHYAPSGWINYNPLTPNMSVDDMCTDNPHSSPHCFKIHWTGGGTQKGNYCGVAWLEPDPGSGTWIINEEGYDLRGVTHISFWVRTDPQYNDYVVKCFLGDLNDSSGVIPPQADNPSLWWEYTLSSEWEYKKIDISYPPFVDYDMSHVSLGFIAVLGEQGYPAEIGSGGYTLYIDDIRFLGPQEAMAEYAFPGGDKQGWVFTTIPSMFQEPGYSNGDGYLRITGPGTLEARGCAGMWNSPIIPDPVSKPYEIGVVPEEVYRMRATVGTDITNIATVPQFRLRIGSSTWETLTTTSIRSMGDASISPVAGADKTYDVYYTMPKDGVNNRMRLAFDYLNVDASDSATGYLDLKNVTVKHIADVIEAREITRYNFPGGDTQGWNFNVFQAPVTSESGDGFLRIKGAGTIPSAGWWQSPAITGIQARRLYKAVFKIGTDIADKTTVPMFVMSVYSQSATGSPGDWKMSTEKTISSSNLENRHICPSAGNDKTYEVYFTMPRGATDDRIFLALFYYNYDANDSPTGAIDLKEVIIYEATEDRL